MTDTVAMEIVMVAVKDVAFFFFVGHLHVHWFKS